MAFLFLLRQKIVRSFLIPLLIQLRIWYAEVLNVADVFIKYLSYVL